MKTKPAHTPTPWGVEPLTERVTQKTYGAFRIFSGGEDGLPIPRTEANTEFIVRAVNSHAELVAALETAVAQFDFTVAAMANGQKVSISSLQNCAANARAALAKAKGQS